MSTEHFAETAVPDRALLPLSAREVIARMEQIIDRYPEAGDYRVHLLDMDENVPEDEASNLVTVVELDAFSEEQGMVISLMAWRNPPKPGGVHVD